MKIFIVIGATLAGLSVAFGAFGAHILERILEPKYLDIWGKGVTYQMLHAVGMILVGILLGKTPGNSLLTWSGWLMFIGVLLFSGSLYVLSVTKISMLGAITPLGGVSFIIAWILIIVAAVKFL
ncbi:DUF423 domain-containing protein [Niallia sp. Krafla_26]|uniref:DUF423 domain-containing protein n=1 Tax=Niallia sp. Krafla_26 TaxID=3064703 RepID=UPI003D1732FD